MKKAYVSHKPAFKSIADRMINAPRPSYESSESAAEYDIQEILARNSRELKDLRAKQGR